MVAITDDQNRKRIIYSNNNWFGLDFTELEILHLVDLFIQLSACMHGNISHTFLSHKSRLATMDMELEMREEAMDDNLEVDTSMFEDGGIQEIDKLESVGINVSDIKKLKAAGLYTMASVMMATTSVLTSIKGLSEIKVQKIIDCVKKVCHLWLLVVSRET